MSPTKSFSIFSLLLSIVTASCLGCRNTNPPNSSAGQTAESGCRRITSDHQMRRIQYFLRNNIDSASAHIHRTKTAAIAKNDHYSIILCSIYMSELKLLTSEFILAEKQADTALRLLRSYPCDHLKVRALIAKGKSEDKLFNTVKATVDLLAARNIASKNGDVELLSAASLALGIVNGNNKNFNQAFTYFKRCLNLPIQPNTESDRLFALYGLGVTYSMSGDINIGLKYLSRALNKAEEGGNDILKTKILLNIAKTQLGLGNPRLALRYYRQTESFAIINGLRDQVAMANLGIAVALDDPTKSPGYFNKAMSISRTTGNKLIKLGILENLIAFHRKHKNYRYALQFSDQYHQLKDSIFTLSKSTQIAALESINDLQRAKSRVHQMEISLLKSTQEKNFNIILSLLLLIIIVIIGFSLFRQRSLIDKINQERKKVDRLNEMNERILKILGHDLVGPMSALNAMLHLLKNDRLEEEEKNTLLSQLILAQAQTIDTLDKVLKWGNQRTGTIDLRKAIFHPARRLKATVDLLQPLAFKKQIIMSLNVQESLSIYADPIHFDFILRNIIQNAIKFSSPGKKIEIGQMEEVNGDVTIYVYNEGPPFSQKELEYIRSGGYIPHKGTANEHGTGLGLKLSEEFLAANGGQLFILPSTETGTKVAIRFFGY